MPLKKQTRSGWRLRLGLTLAFLTVAFTLILSACGGGSSGGSQARYNDLPSVEEILDSASEAVSSVVSYRSERHMEVRRQADGPIISDSNITLTWATPGRVHILIEGKDVGEEAQSSEFISTDGRVMARESSNGNIWTEYDTDPKSAERTVVGVLAMVRRFSSAPDFVPTMEKAELIGTEVIENLSVYHIRGVRSFRQEIPDENPDGIFDDMSLQRDETTYDFYVSTSDFLPRRLLTETNLRWETSEGEASEPEPVYLEIIDEFLEYNAAVSIKLPEVP